MNQAPTAIAAPSSAVAPPISVCCRIGGLSAGSMVVLSDEAREAHARAGFDGSRSRLGTPAIRSCRP
jgi:hypothetical protein